MHRVLLCLLDSGSRVYSEDSLKIACDYQAALDASFGGTEILQPLRAIYDKPPMTTHSRQVFAIVQFNFLYAEFGFDNNNNNNNKCLKN